MENSDECLRLSADNEAGLSRSTNQVKALKQALRWLSYKLGSAKPRDWRWQLGSMLHSIEDDVDQFS